VPVAAGGQVPLWDAKRWSRLPPNSHPRVRVRTRLVQLDLAGTLGTKSPEDNRSPIAINGGCPSAAASVTTPHSKFSPRPARRAGERPAAEACRVPFSDPLDNLKGPWGIGGETTSG